MALYHAVYHVGHLSGLPDDILAIPNKVGYVSRDDFITDTPQLLSIKHTGLTAWVHYRRRGNPTVHSCKLQVTATNFLTVALQVQNELAPAPRHRGDLRPRSKMVELIDVIEEMTARELLREADKQAPITVHSDLYYVLYNSFIPSPRNRWVVCAGDVLLDSGFESLTGSAAHGQPIACASLAEALEVMDLKNAGKSIVVDNPVALSPALQTKIDRMIGSAGDVAPATHDYGPNKRRWGHDYTIHKVYDNGLGLDLSGWGYGLEEGHYILLDNQGESTRYQIATIDYHRNPPDMWKAHVKFAPRNADMKG